MVATCKPSTLEIGSPQSKLAKVRDAASIYKMEWLRKTPKVNLWHLYLYTCAPTQTYTQAHHTHSTHTEETFEASSCLLSQHLRDRNKWTVRIPKPTWAIMWNKRHLANQYSGALLWSQHLGRLRQEHPKFQSSLEYVSRLCLKKKSDNIK